MGGTKFSIRDTLLSLSSPSSSISSQLQPRRRRRQQQQQQQPRPSSDLWDLVVDRDWDAVRYQIETHPEDVRYMDGHYRETVLYLVMQQHDPPPDVVQRLVDVHPGALVESCTKNHDYPLHVACSFDADPSVIKLVVGSNPATAVLQTRWGKTPLVALWELRQKRKELRRQQQQQRRQQEQRRLEQHREQQGINNQEEERQREAETPDIVEDNDIERNDVLFWEKAEIILRGVALYRRSLRVRESTASTSFRLQDDNGHSFIVHAAVSLGSLGCPCPILEWVLRKYPEQVQMKDEHGLLPLHVCIGPSQWTTSLSGGGGGGQRKYRPRERDVIKSLLKIYPDAAKSKMRIRRQPRMMKTKYSATKRWYVMTKIKEKVRGLMEYIIQTEISTARSIASTTRKKEEEEVKMRPDTSYTAAAATTRTITGRRDSPCYYYLYPLQYALINRHWWNGGVDELFQAFPDALKIPDQATQLYAFQLAAILPTSTACTTTTSASTTMMMDPESSVDLETVYQLLRMNPNILDRFIVPQPDYAVGNTHTYTCNIQ